MRDEVGLGQLLSRRRKRHQVHRQPPTDGGLGIEAQALGVSDGDQEQLQSPGAVIGTGQIFMADQAMVHPTEARGNEAQPLRQEMFLDHVLHRFAG